MTAPAISRPDSALATRLSADIEADLCTEGRQGGNCIYCSGPETD